VWVFDPQGICGEPPTWWWNPLGGIGNEVDAQKLAAIFVAASRPVGARTDAYFDGAGEDLLAGLILAAAVTRRPVTQVYLWLTRPTDTEPAILLEQAGFALVAAGVRNVIDAPDKQRGGVYGTAQRVVNFMTNSAAMTWCTPGTGQARPQFHPDQFVSDGLQTLYSISKEGQGSAGPVVTALTVAVTEAAERLSERSPLGRLPIPMVLVLDEAANVCRWTELPNLYSHFGSRGIVVLTILQSWAQGVTGVITDRKSRLTRPMARWTISYLLDDRTRSALAVAAPPAPGRLMVEAYLRSQAAVQRRQSPPASWFTSGGPQDIYPDGYSVNDLGPTEKPAAPLTSSSTRDQLLRRW